MLLEAQSRPEALERLLPLVYDELRRIAHRERRRLAPHETLATTAVVHEAYLRLVDATRVGWSDRAHFFATAARAMRYLLVDDARRRSTARHGGNRAPLALDGLHLAAAQPQEDLVALDEALARLERLDGRLGRVVECRFFAGLTVDETAEALALSPRSVERAWRKARAWLYHELREAA